MPRSELSSAASQASFTTYSEDTAGAHEEPRTKKKYKWHKKFAYQKFKGWRPILSPRTAELFFLSAGVLLVALGVPILIASLNVVEYKVPYAFEGPFAGKTPEQRQQLLWDQPDGGGVAYPVTVLIEDRMEPPIWVSFELGSFFQNFRRYVRSFDPARMHDGSDAGGPISACQPFSYVGDNSSLPINPCGQIAASLFNDSFQLFATPAGAGGAAQPLAVDSSDIAWPSDRKHLYGAVEPKNYNDVPPLRSGGTSDVVLNQNQQWMVWMKPHSQVAIQKLYGRIDTALEAGTTLTIQVSNKYNTYEFSGAKAVIISTNSWVGGRNIFLGAVYLATGGLCLLTALFFFLGHDMKLIKKRVPGDLNELSWLKPKKEQQGRGAVAGGNDDRASWASSSMNQGRGAVVQVLAYQDAAADDPQDGAITSPAMPLPVLPSKN